MRCRLCGFEFDASGLACHTSCPLGSKCSIICCPNCGYQAVDESRSWTARMLSRLWKSTPEEEAALPFNRGQIGLLSCPLSQAPVGVEVEVERMQQEMPTSRQARLSVFGLVPGSRVRVLQHQPVPVLSIGETELSLSQDFLDQIWVRSPGGAREVL
jgi:Fe2+ transport system protein FeoA